MPTAEKLDLAHLALSVAIVGTARDLLAAAREWLTEAGTVRVPVVRGPHAVRPDGMRASAFSACARTGTARHRGWIQVGPESANYSAIHI